MLKRKIKKTLLDWKNSTERKPLVIKGLRQCGKTSSVREFGRENYEHVIYMNFLEDPGYAAIFSGSLKTDDLVMYISAYLGPEAIFEENKTLIIFDEIQHCNNARTSLKFFKLDGRFDVIATGSLLGTSGYGEQELSIPVGFEEVVEMYPLDFEEFLWANGISDEIIDLLRSI